MIRYETNMIYMSSLVGCDVNPVILYFRRIFPLWVTSTFTPRSAFFIWQVNKHLITQITWKPISNLNKCQKHDNTFTWLESENGLKSTSFPKSWATNSITGNGSINAAEDISKEHKVGNFTYNKFTIILKKIEIHIPILRDRPIWVGLILW